MTYHNHKMPPPQLFMAKLFFFRWLNGPQRKMLARSLVIYGTVHYAIQGAWVKTFHKIVKACRFSFNSFDCKFILLRWYNSLRGAYAKIKCYRLTAWQLETSKKHTSKNNQNRVELINKLRKRKQWYNVTRSNSIFWTQIKSYGWLS